MDTAADQCICGGNAWVVLDHTGENVRCDGYIKGENKMQGPVLPIVSAATCVVQDDGEEFILTMNQACYNQDDEQTESLCLPYQAEQHGIKFDLTPRHRLNASGQNGKQIFTIEDREVPLEFDGLKMFVRIRRPTDDDLSTLPMYELTSPLPFVPDNGEDHENVVNPRRKKVQVLPGNLPMSIWQKRLAYAPEDVIRKTFAATTQYGMSVEAENRVSGRRHYKSRFQYMKEKRINDVFHSDTFFPTVHTMNGDTCSQIFIGKSTDYMKVYPMKKQSHSFRALQDFTRKVGIPRGIKTDNATTEVGLHWTNYCRNHRIDTSFTEPHSPWQNYAEHGIGDLGRMVSRCMSKFNVPLNRHYWCQKWCCDVRNHLASRKLNWRTPEEKISGETPDISVFRFHFWEEVEYYDPTLKQPNDGWIPARFMGIAWDSGDFMTYYVEPQNTRGRPTVLVRSTVRPMRQSDQISADPSGEIQNPGEPEESREYQNIIGEDPTETSTNDLETESDGNVDTTQESSNVTEYHGATVHDDAVNYSSGNNFSVIEDEQDDALVHEQLINETNDDMDDFEFDYIKDYKWDDGLLVFEVMLLSGKTYEIPFNVLKKDRPIETAKFIREKVVEGRRGGKYNLWSKKIIKQSQRTLRRLSRYHNIDRVLRLRKMKTITLNMRRASRNSRNDRFKQREKFGIRIPNNVREALMLDRMNKNNLWADAIAKEMGALNNMKCFKYYPGHYRFTSQYHYAPLRMIFDIKKEDFRRKARLVAGGHVVNATMFESYSSVVQTKSLRLLQAVALNEGLKIVTADIRNAFIQATTKEKIWTRCGDEFGDRAGCVAKIKKALYGLSTSARQWSLKLGDTLKSLGFTPSRADPDLWIKQSDDNTHYEYIGTHVDDMIVVSKDPMKYINIIKKIYPLRNVEENPEFYLGNNVKIKSGAQIKISMEKYIKEAIRRFELKHGSLRKENSPHAKDDHPELDDTNFLDSNGINDYQSIIGVCQWISISARMDITFAVSSLSRFASKPREGHMKRALRILGYLKKYPKKGYIIDPRAPIENINYEKVQPDFGNQYDFKEEIDEKLPESKMRELKITIFADSNHGHDLVTGKSITGVIVFVGRTPIKYISKRQASVQTSTFGAEFMALKRAVEEAVTIRYYLRSMGVRVDSPTVIYGDNMSSIKIVTDASSPLKKKYLALAYHFCREHYSAGIVEIRKIDTKHNLADPFTKSLVSPEHHTHFNSFMAD